jgi:hypothetical protein
MNPNLRHRWPPVSRNTRTRPPYRGRTRAIDRAVGFVSADSARVVGVAAALPDVIVGQPRRYSPRLTHDLENDGKSAGRMLA